MQINEDFLPKDVYSTNEIKTNKTWIDGKPIYRKIYKITNITLDSNNQIFFGSILGIDNITKMRGILYRSNGNHFTVPTYNGTYYASLHIDDVTYDKFGLTTNITSLTEAIIIVEYTKK